MLIAPWQRADLLFSNCDGRRVVY